MRLRLPHVGKQPEVAAAVPRNDVLPFQEGLGLPAGAAPTDDGRGFRGTERRPYGLHPALDGIEHRKARVRAPRIDGFVERSDGTVPEEFLRPAMHAKPFGSVGALQADLDPRPHRHDRERPHPACRNRDAGRGTPLNVLPDGKLGRTGVRRRHEPRRAPADRRVGGRPDARTGFADDHLHVS